MSDRTLYVHVGPPKTGSSASQALLRDGGVPDILYPRTGQWQDGAHHMLTFGLAGVERRGDVEIPPPAETLDALVREVAASDADVVVSSEGFTPKTLRLFLERFAPDRLGFARVRVIFVLRDPVELAASRYNQGVKDPEHGERRDPDRFLVETQRQMCGAELVAAFAAASPAFTLVRYHPAESFLTRFAAAIDRPDTPIPERLWRNRSMGGKALLTLVAANRLAADAAGRRAFFDTLRGDKSFGIWSGDSFPFSPEALATTAPVFDEDRRAVAEATGVAPAPYEPPARIALTAPDVAAMHAHLSGLPGYPDRRGEIDALFAPFRERVDG